jgi:tryptophan-rich sensory protein
MMQVVLWCVVCAIAYTLVGFGGSLLTLPSLTPWYATIIKPPLNPPNWVFAPVWTTLYILLGISLGFVIARGKAWVAPSRGDLVAAHVWTAALNLLWSLTFFGLHHLWLAIVVIVLLVWLGYATFRATLRQHKLVGWLLLPYLLWVSFATYLNVAIAMLNT